VGTPFSTRTANTPSVTSAATHPLIVDIARLRTRSSKISDEIRELDLFIIGAEPSIRQPVRPPTVPADTYWFN
jgi:hypothetical protein